MLKRKQKFEEHCLLCKKKLQIKNGEGVRRGGLVYLGLGTRGTHLNHPSKISWMKWLQ